MQVLKEVPEKGKCMLWFSFHSEKLSYKSIDKWLHSAENGKSVIDFLINMKDWKLCFTENDFEKINVKNARKASDWATIDEELPDVEHVEDSLNQYFKEHFYPFAACHNSYTAYIVQTKPLFCAIHGKNLTTESNLVEHRECLSKYASNQTIKQKELIKDIIVDDIDPTTKKKQEKRRAEEIKARRDY